MRNRLMENKLFNTNEELLDFFIEQLDTEEDIVLVIDRQIAKQISEYFEEDDFEDYYGISIESDVDEYYVEKVEDLHFCIEPSKYLSEYLKGDTKKLIIMKEFLCDELLESQNVEEIVIVDLEEDLDESDEPCICCEDCHGCDEDEECDCEDCKIGEEELDLINEYYGLMKDSDFEEKAVKQALMEFGETVLREFSLEDDKE